MSDTDAEWYHVDGENDAVATAPSLWRPIARRVGGFDVDPASGCEPEPIADVAYTEADDGLTSPWYGTVWLNPPFSDRGTWYKRLVNQYRNGDVERAVAVGKPPTSSDWFHDWFVDADLVAFLDERDHYLGNGDNPSFSTILAVWNPTAELRDWLQTQGTLMTPSADEAQTSLGEVSDE